MIKKQIKTRNERNKCIKNGVKIKNTKLMNWKKKIREKNKQIDELI